MSRILILYSSSLGHTAKISRRLLSYLVETGHQVRLEPIENSASLNLAEFDKIVLGARIRYGHHAPEVVRFVQEHRQALEGVPSAFFSVNLVARKASRSTPQTNPYMVKFLAQTGWQPTRQAVFAGKVDYPSYNPLQRLAIRFIMWLMKGETARDAVVEYTDWQRVESFAGQIASM